MGVVLLFKIQKKTNAALTPENYQQVFPILKPFVREQGVRGLCRVLLHSFSSGFDSEEIAGRAIYVGIEV